jgi:hypothetical protein
MDYNILYEEQPLLDYFLVKTSDCRYVYKGETNVLQKETAHRFRTKQSAKRYAEKYGLQSFLIVGVKKTGGKLRYVFFD